MVLEFLRETTLESLMMFLPVRFPTLLQAESLEFSD